MVVAVAVGGGVAVLLQFKGELHGIAKKLGDEDLRAIMQFVLISCVILPVLPNQNFGPSKLFAPGRARTGRVQSVRDLADGRAHRGHEPGRIHRL